jgi:hypothetical protein
MLHAARWGALLPLLLLLHLLLHLAHLPLLMHHLIRHVEVFSCLREWLAHVFGLLLLLLFCFFLLLLCFLLLGAVNASWALRGGQRLFRKLVLPPPCCPTSACWFRWWMW